MSATCVVESAVAAEARGFVGPPAEAVEAILFAPEEDRLKTVAASWSQSCRSDVDRFKEGLALVTEVAGLPTSCFPDAGAFHPRANVVGASTLVDAIYHAVEDVVPLPGSLADITTSQATTVARNLQMFFLFGCSALLYAEGGNSDGLVVGWFMDWLPVMAGASLRCLRHSAIAAGLGILEALVNEIGRLTNAIDACDKQLRAIDTDQQGSGCAQRKDRLRHEIQEQSRRLHSLRARASMMRDSVLRPHLRDRTSGIRLLAINSISFLIQNDPDFYRCPPWPERILRAFCDPSAEVRFCAVQAVMGWFCRPESESEAPSATSQTARRVTRQLDELVPHTASLLVERARDVNPKVSLAAMKALRFPKLAMGLGEKDIDSLVSLCFHTPESMLRREIAFFIDEHLLVDPGVGAATRRSAVPIRQRYGENMQPIVLQASEALRNLYRSEHGLLVFTDFLVHHLRRDCFSQIERIVEAFWGSAPCLKRWTTMADLCLLGEGEGPSRSVTALPALQRLAMLHLIDATLLRASDEYSRGEDMETVEEAAKALLPRLSRLLDLFSADEAAMKPLSMSAKRVVEHSCRHLGVLPPRVLLPSLQKAISKQGKLQTAENLVDALVLLARQSSEARTLIFSLVKDVRNNSETALRMHKSHVKLDDLAPCLVTLLAFCKRGVDISSGYYGLLSAALKFLSEPWAKEGAEKDPRVSICIILQLLELVVLVLMWRIRAVVSAAAAETPQASRLDLDENGVEMDSLCGPPASPQDREMLPQVTCQLFEISIHLVRKTPKALSSAPVIQMQAMSTYLTLAQAVLGSDGHLGILRGFLSEDRITGVVRTFTPPKEHVLAMERGLASLYENAVASAAPMAPLDLDWQRSEQGKDDGQSERMVMKIAAYRKSMEQLMDPYGEIKNASQFPCLAACVVSWMISTCEIDAIYAGPPGRLLLAQAANNDKLQVIGEVARHFAENLRKRALCSSVGASLFFSMEFAAVDYAIAHDGAEAGQRLSESFVMSSRPSSPTGTEDVRLKAGFSKAVRAFVNSAAAVKQPARLEAVLPWLRGSGCCFLSLADAKAMHREFSAKFGAGVIQGAANRMQIAMRALLLALQPLANAVTENPQRRTGALSHRFVRQARRRLKLGSKKTSSSKTSSTPFAPTGWLEKKRCSATPPSKRARRSNTGLSDSRRKLAAEAAGETKASRTGEGLDATKPQATISTQAPRKRNSRSTLQESKAPKVLGTRKTKRKADEVNNASVGQIVRPAPEPASTGAERVSSVVPPLAPEAANHQKRGLKRSIASDDLGSKVFASHDTDVKRPHRESVAVAAAVALAASPQPLLLDNQSQSIGRSTVLRSEVRPIRSLETKILSSALPPEPASVPASSGRNWRLRKVSERSFY